MKKSHLLPLVPAGLLVGALAIINYGCGKKNEAPVPGVPPQASAGIMSAEKTSFNEVTAQLDAGGNFYLYLGTAQWLDNLSGKVGSWRGVLTALPDLKPEDTANINKAFDVATRVIKDSGIEDVSGVGMSSIEIEKGMFRNKAILHHYAGKGDGFLWQLAGKEAHPLTGLDYLPANTAFAMFSDADLPLVWKVLQKEVAAADIPQAQQWLDQLPAQFEQATQVKWDTFVNSLGGEFGLVVTLDPANQIPVPLPSGSLQVPTPGLMLVVKVNDDTIFNFIDKQLQGNGQVLRVDKSGLKMRTMPVPIPFVGELRPSAASGGGYLFIASADALIDEALAVRGGQKSGLKSTDEFKHISQGIPDQGNQFVFVSQRFADVMMQVQQQAIASSAKDQGGIGQLMQSLYKSRPAFAYSVGVNTPEGCLTVGNSSQSYANSVLLAPAAAIGMMSAIAIPNFVKARTVSQENACINNLRMIDGAKQQWALEKGKKDTDTPTKEDLLPYLSKWPTCPQGGTYTIGAISEKPTCTIPGHELP